MAQKVAGSNPVSHPNSLPPVYFVYILYCPLTGLTYVGQTSHLLLRYYEHRDGQSHRLPRSTPVPRRRTGPFDGGPSGSGLSADVLLYPRHTTSRWD